MIKRTLEETVRNSFFKQKAVIIIGARQTGKTTLVKSILGAVNRKVIYFNGDESDTNEIFASYTVSGLQNIIGNHEIIFFDEAQRISNIGLIIKLIVDHFEKVQVIATGSSAFDLSNSLNEPLTGRKYEFHMYPLSYNEMALHHGAIEEKRNLERRLITGSYPQIVTNPGEDQTLLKLLADSYLYKDILMLGNINKPLLLDKILRGLSLQTGNEVSFAELARLVDSDKKTVEKYIDLLEKACIIFRLPALSGNARTEIRKGNKIYFYDNGIRNAVISDLRHPTIRNDIGALWENYLISERTKLLSVSGLNRKQYFWRTVQQQEIDYIEVENDRYYAFEFKWKRGKNVFLSKTFASAYPEHEFRVITPDNYGLFLTEI